MYSPSPLSRPPRQRLRRAVLAALALTTSALFASGSALAEGQYTWVNEAPESIEGTWVVSGERCEDENSHLAIFSNGGYRWRQSRTEWGYARGKYSYESAQWGTIYFRLQRLEPDNTPDYSISVSGTELRKYSLGSGKMERYDKCVK